MDAYEGFASVYDALLPELDYAAWVDYLERLFARRGKHPELVLELACGTGSATLELAARGYDMIGLDLSEEMLAEAREKQIEAGMNNILLLHQDMTDFELYGTVDAIVCLLDSVNYITAPEKLERMFTLCMNYLNPDGILIFDFNMPYKFSEVLGQNTITVETDDVFCVWNNDYDESSRLNRFELTVFEREGECYTRFDETHEQYCYLPSEIRAMLEKCGFGKIELLGELSDDPPADGEERAFFVCEKTLDKPSRV